MPKVSDVCRYVRSKAAGPFWVTVDLFFDSPETFRTYHDHPALGPDTFARLYDVDAAWVKRTPVPDLAMLKVSYPRPTPQGWITERDMHSGQQYVRLLGVDLD
ncbi:DUF4387 domain-containing protein [Phenylobacterium terrae]|uniref:DUF4387 domain-containing protein n=1 Tax=Phenylobacterium terrae TaxID=2665495 RepID=A0ABW4N8F1_9CAUL